MQPQTLAQSTQQAFLLRQRNRGIGKHLSQFVVCCDQLVKGFEFVRNGCKIVPGGIGQGAGIAIGK